MTTSTISPSPTPHSLNSCITIVGGGMVGATTAVLLAKHLPNTSILLIDADSAKKQAPSSYHENRVFALNLASIALLKQAGVWHNITRKADYTGMQVWSTNGAGQTFFGDAATKLAGDNPSTNQLLKSNPYQTSDILGSMVEPSVILAALAKELANYNNLTCLFDTKVTGINNIAGSFQASQQPEELANQPQNTPKTPIKWQLQLTENEHDTHKSAPDLSANNQQTHYTLHTSLVIACDGRQSFIRNAVGIGVDTLDYKKTAITCALQTEKPHQSIARQVFLPSGPLAILPLSDIEQADITPADTVQKHSNITYFNADRTHQPNCWQSIVWTLPTAEAQLLLAEPHGHIANKIIQASEYSLGNALHIESVASFPLSAMHAKTYIDNGLVLVGDSAHGVHPLAGQGLNLGMLDVAVLTDLLIYEWQYSLGETIGSHDILARYQQKRRRHNATMMHSFSAIGWAFAEQNYPTGHVVQWLRSEVVKFGSKFTRATKIFDDNANGLAHLKGTRWQEA